MNLTWTRTRLLVSARRSASIVLLSLLNLLGIEPTFAQESPAPEATSSETISSEATVTADGSQEELERAELEPARQQAMIVVVGAAGSEDFEGKFESWGKAWRELADSNGWESTTIHQPTSVGTPAHQQLKSAIEKHQSHFSRVWIVLLGHGTYSSGVAKFNLTGPDVSSSELKAWLEPLTGEVIVVNCSSASAPFLPELSGANRVVVTATRSGSEINYSRFGEYLSRAINDNNADIDHDDSVSLLEAFLAASAKTEGFYRDEARLPSEHALLEDNNDRAGTSGDFYRGIQPTKAGRDGKPIDGRRAARILLFSSPAAVQFPPHLAQQRDAVERAIDQLRSEKSVRAVDDYYDELELLLLKLAGLYDQAEKDGP